MSGDNECARRCEVCRTINLAKSIQQPRVDVSIQEKGCRPPVPCIPITELPVQPTCIRVCTKEQYTFEKGGKKLPPPPLPPVGHGKITYAVKAAILVGSIYFTYSQGIWGDHQDVSEAIKRWQAYIRSFSTKRPPVYDKCGKVQYDEKGDSIILPMYLIYKGLVTTFFSGIVKFPVILKCTYLEYVESMKHRDMVQARERQSARLAKKVAEEKRKNKASS